MPPLRKISAPVASDDLAALRALARAEDRSVSSLIRLAIRDYLTKKNGAAGQGDSAKIDEVTVDACPE